MQFCVLLFSEYCLFLLIFYIFSFNQPVDDPKQNLHYYHSSSDYYFMSKLKYETTHMPLVLFSTRNKPLLVYSLYCNAYLASILV